MDSTSKNIYLICLLYGLVKFQKRLLKISYTQKINGNNTPAKYPSLTPQHVKELILAAC